jgi:uncharacterized protein YciI
MKAVVFYELGNVTMEQVMEVYPRHKTIVDKFADEQKIIAIGPFADPKGGSMGVFKDKATAEDFIKQDPFVIEGIAGKVTIKEWNEILLK